MKKVCKYQKYVVGLQGKITIMEKQLLRQTIYTDGSKKWMFAFWKNGVLNEVKITHKQYLQMKKAGLEFSETDFSQQGVLHHLQNYAKKNGKAIPG